LASGDPRLTRSDAIFDAAGLRLPLRVKLAVPTTLLVQEALTQASARYVMQAIDDV
jgi:hypothetical protein